MENASKALIIAGAILLSILIISLGLIVYNQAKETIGSVNLSEHEIAVFNQKFASYEGQNVAGTTVNNLINAVIASNTASVRDNTGTFVTIKFPTISSNLADNYFVMGVGVCEAGDADVATIGEGKPALRYRAALEGVTLAANINSASAADRPLPVLMTGDSPVANFTQKVQPGQTYKVTMSKDAQSGLINKINVEKR